MNDLNDKLRERWQDRRKKGYNWTKLIAMVLVLVAILVAMNYLNKAGNVMKPQAETINTAAPADSSDNGVNP